MFGVSIIILPENYPQIKVEKLEKEASDNQTIAQVLEVAKRAESIAKEAKAIARSK